MRQHIQVKKINIATPASAPKNTNEERVRKPEQNGISCKE